MIVKMKFLSITGPKADIDRVVDEYLSRYEIHLENALSELKDVKNLKPYIEINPYREWLEKANEYADNLHGGPPTGSGSVTPDESTAILKSLGDQIDDIRETQAKLEGRLSELKDSLRDIEPFVGLDYNIHRVLQFRFIKYRFGKIPREYYDKFEQYIYKNLDAVFFKCHSDDQYVWGVYFVPSGLADNLDAVFTSMHFERFYMPDNYDETPQHAHNRLTNEIEQCSAQISACRGKISQIMETNRDRILAAREKLASLSENFDVRRLAACTTKESGSFYILCGWMAEADAESFAREVADDKNLYCIIEDDQANIISRPPTKLKNPAIFKPFEMFVRMYGLPAYNEIDPTVFVGLTYAFIFGAMFGDVGQGLCLLIGGALLSLTRRSAPCASAHEFRDAGTAYDFKQMELAAIISRAGFFSTIFGFLYGSFFGFENVLPAIWLRPAESMITLPFIGKLNTVFAVAIAFGMFLILTTMILHIINAVKARDRGDILFDANGLSGFAFYAALVTVIILYMAGHSLPADIVMAVAFIIPLILIALKEPVTNLLENKKDVIPGGKGMFIAQTFFELFEMLLSYFSNTLSFVRVGAFAVSHAAMMQVVMMLAGAENGGSPNWIVVIIGNIFISVMEGLIVGIQVLRLEYYEMFSRFYKGDGREFKSSISRKA